MRRGAIAAAVIVFGLVLSTAESSIPINVVRLRCLQPVTFRCAIPTNQAGNTVTEGLAVRDLLARAGVPEPLVEVQTCGIKIHTYAASDADADRLEQIIRRQLSALYPALVPPDSLHRLLRLHDYAQRANSVIRSRLQSLEGIEWQSGVSQANLLWVGIHAPNREFEQTKWVWQRRGQFEAYLLPEGCCISDGAISAVGREPGEMSAPYDDGNRVPAAVMLQRSVLLMSNDNPAADASVHQAGNQFGVVLTLQPGPGARMQQMTSRSIGRQMALVWDDEVFTARYINQPIGPRFTILAGRRGNEPRLQGEEGRRTAAQLAACLKSGPLPTPLIEATPEPSIPDSVTTFLSRAYPGCRLLTYDDYGPEMWATLFIKLRYIAPMYGENYHPFAVRGDFDGNGKGDWALLLKCGETVKLAALHHAGTTWDPHVVSEREYEGLFQSGLSGISLYLEPVRAGQARGRFELGRDVQVSRDSFEEVFGEKAAWLWQWDGEKYTRFVSGD